MTTLDLIVGFVAMMIWGALCGVPALAIYNLAQRTRTGWRTWVLFIGGMLVWLPLVTVICVWGVLHLIGLDVGTAAGSIAHG
jgi:hypothetical protein